MSQKPRHPWTDIEDDILRAQYATTLTADLAKRLDHSLTSTYRRARKLGLSKDRQWIADTARQRIEADPEHGSRFTRIRPGNVPLNKGIKRPDGWAPGRMAETQFRPGRAASEARNYRPIGSLRLSKDGYLERKITDDPSLYPARRWVAEHRLVWEASHGPIPAGHMVVFRPGLRTTDPDLVTVDRLECITRQENMRRHTFHQYGPEVAAVMRLRGAITRQINKRLENDREQQEHQ